MNDIEKGWLAGIMDGEGTITLTKGGLYRHPMISVASCTPEILNEVKRLCNCGIITPKRNYKSNHSPSWVWKVGYQQAI